jgi:hypothetical protein
VCTGDGVSDGPGVGVSVGCGELEVGSGELDEGSGVRDDGFAALTGLAAYTRVGPEVGDALSDEVADGDEDPGDGEKAGDGCAPGHPLLPGDAGAVGPSSARAEPMMSDAGVSPGGPFWIEANAAVVPSTATTATSGTTSRSSTPSLFPDTVVDDDLRVTSATRRVN